MTTSTCRQGVRLLAGYMEGVLARATRRDLDRHVRGCGRCQGFVKSYVATPRIVREATGSTMSDRVRRSLRSRLVGEGAVRR